MPNTAPSLPTDLPTGALPAAGWYAHPALPGSELWWSGAEWTQHSRAAGAETPAPGAFAAQPYSIAATSGPTSKMLQPAVSSLVFGILSLFLNVLFLATIVALVRGAQASRRAKDFVLDGQPPHGRSLATWGRVLGLVGIFTGLAQTGVLIWAWADYLL
jgi:hypothetical protein